MSNRFDLEQQIMDCWNILNDIETLADMMATTKAYTDLANVYEYKFNKLWRTFEDMVYNKEFAQDDTNAVHT